MYNKSILREWQMQLKANEIAHMAPPGSGYHPLMGSNTTEAGFKLRT